MALVKPVTECPTDYIKCVPNTQHVTWDANDNIQCAPLGDTIKLTGCVVLPQLDKDPVPCFEENDPCGPCACGGDSSSDEFVTAEEAAQIAEDKVNECVAEFSQGQIDDKAEG